ncbi:hypothetical protein LC605_11185 [Nostoc sp. CHAB 5836]|uniref:hypothetical protein n=1 Tax=Nostoc sp. CHAB 5836 TaxID=2780404 RepID=UPI001E5BC396|nr:hypothetical protein [Nostoc sp. CHAB 5836]MCC5615625.1 hypothetical protein [Nostoc sp. CHAB 5836]
MKNNYFSKVPLLVMSLLVISSGQALSLSSNSKDLGHGDGLGNADLVIAQNNKDSISVGFAVAVVVKALDTVVSQTQTVARTIPVNIPSNLRDVVLPKLQAAVGSVAKAESSSKKGDNFETATALAQAVTVLGQAQASADASTPSLRAIANVIVKANQAIAIAQGVGTSKPTPTPKPKP